MCVRRDDGKGKKGEVLSREGEKSRVMEWKKK
jgi:hypothetical protein